MTMLLNLTFNSHLKSFFELVQASYFVSFLLKCLFCFLLFSCDFFLQLRHLLSLKVGKLRKLLVFQLNLFFAFFLLLVCLGSWLLPLHFLGKINFQLRGFRSYHQVNNLLLIKCILKSLALLSSPFLNPHSLLLHNLLSPSLFKLQFLLISITGLLSNLSRYKFLPHRLLKMFLVLLSNLLILLLLVFFHLL